MKSLFALGTLLIIIIASLAASDVRAQALPVNEIRQELDRAKKGFTSQLESTRLRAAAELERKGPCTETLDAIYRRELELAMTFGRLGQRVDELLQQVAPIANIQVEIAGLAQQVRELQDKRDSLQSSISESNAQLDKIHQNQSEAIRDWLVKEFANKPSPPISFQVGSEKVLIQQTLFGAFVIHAPQKLEYDIPQETRVEFSPSLFSNSLFAGSSPLPIRIGPTGISSTLPDGLEFVAEQVVGGGAGGSGRKFTMTESDQVLADPTKSTTWYWRTRADRQFRGGEFDLFMGARPESQTPSSGEGATLKLPVEIAYEAGKPWWERFSSYLAIIPSAVVGFVTGGLLFRRNKTWELKLLDAQAKQKKDDEAKAKKNYLPED